MFDNTVTLRSGIKVEQERIGHYLADFYRDGQKLVVTFEPANKKIDWTDSRRDAWSLKFLVERGYSVLGIKAPAETWYRGQHLGDWFASPNLKSFFASFDDCIFTGASMGGFAALSFSRIAPGSLLVVHNPQSSLRKDLVPWETRYPNGARLDWNSIFADAREAVPFARRIYASYDPFHPIDRLHIERLEAPNLVHLKMPFLGHHTPVWLLKLGLLKDVSELALSETLTTERFAKMIRTRRTLERYRQIGAWRLKTSGRRKLAKVFKAASKAIALPGSSHP